MCHRCQGRPATPPSFHDSVLTPCSVIPFCLGLGILASWPGSAYCDHNEQSVFPFPWRAAFLAVPGPVFPAGQVPGGQGRGFLGPCCVSCTAPGTEQVFSKCCSIKMELGLVLAEPTDSALMEPGLECPSLTVA